MKQQSSELELLLADIQFRLNFMPVYLEGNNQALPDPDFGATSLWYGSWSNFMTRVRLNDSIYNHVENHHR